MSESADPILDALHAARRLRTTANAAAAAAATAEEEAVCDALDAGMSSARIMREAGLAESRVRAIRIENGFGPDPRYAHLRPPVPGKKETPS